jgi:hypothetical protein
MVKESKNEHRNKGRKKGGNRKLKKDQKQR